MPRFFVESLSDTVVLAGEDARHISRSLRMRAGESLTLCDGRGNEAEGTIVSFSADAVSVRLGEFYPSESEPKTEVSLYLAVSKGDKLELVVQKAVEIGAAEIVLLLTSRCISRPKGPDAEKKVARLQKIALEAAKQSGRGRVPAVRGILSFSQALDEMEQFPASFTLYEGECPPLRAQLPGAPCKTALLIGSEGGFSPDEIAGARARSVRPASLGPRILRCETAPLAALSALLFAMGDLD